MSRLLDTVELTYQRTFTADAEELGFTLSTREGPDRGVQQSSDPCGRCDGSRGSETGLRSVSVKKFLRLFGQIRLSMPAEWNSYLLRLL